MPVTPKNIDRNIRLYLKGRDKSKGRRPEERYATFDYCFNYFQSFREKGNIAAIAAPAHLQSSCLHLAYYLASWGMLRGGTVLLEKSLVFYKRLIKYFAGLNGDPVWEIDVPWYTAANIRKLLRLKDGIRKNLGVQNNPTETLITKIMLGVFGNVPAFDSLFKYGFSITECGESQLKKIAKFYSENKKAIDRFKVRTLDFHTGKETPRRYPKAKLIDMIGFIQGRYY